MPVIEKHPKGAPCWFELGTTDQNAAKQFYSQLFDWTIVDSPMGPGEVYTMFFKDGQSAGSAYTMPPKLRDQGVPPHWAVYFATPDADDSARKVVELGGALIEAPFDVADYGRMAICTDPGGAVFSLWQPRTHQGAGVVGENNAVCWSELASWDVPKARDFYTALFGWDAKASAGMATYIEFTPHGGFPSGGLMPMDESWKGVPSHWGIYFMVADCTASAAKAQQLGAKLRHGPFDAPGVGRIAILADPQGAGFSLITLASA